MLMEFTFLLNSQHKYKRLGVIMLTYYIHMIWQGYFTIPENSFQ